MSERIRAELQSAATLFTSMAADIAFCGVVARAADMALSALKRGGKILICGNGGSAADAQHWAAEFVSRFNFDRPALAAIALTTDTSILTAIGNDYGYQRVFARQVEALGHQEDVLFAISTSGNSVNILEAVKTAKQKGMATIGFTGANGHALASIASECIHVPSSSTPIIQLGHEAIGHAICNLIEQEMFQR